MDHILIVLSLFHLTVLSSLTRGFHSQSCLSENKADAAAAITFPWRREEGKRGTDRVHLPTKVIPLQIFPGISTKWLLLTCQSFLSVGEAGNCRSLILVLFLEQGTLLPFPVSKIHGNVTDEEREDKYEADNLQSSPQARVRGFLRLCKVKPQTLEKLTVSLRDFPRKILIRPPTN